MFRNTFSSRRRLALIVAFMAMFLVVLNATTYALFRRARSHLDNELGERLRGIASVLAHTVELAVTDSLTTQSAGAALYPTLYATREENLLSNIVLLSPDGTTILDLSGYSAPGEANPFVELDYGAVALAKSGIPSYTNLYRAGDDFMKSAYAPVSSPSGTVAAIVGVEAGAGFFSVLRSLSNVIIAISLGSLVVVVVLGAVLYRQSRSLDRAQEAIIKRENLATMGRMVANIAHEIRNPLSIIRTSADRIRRSGEVDDEMVAYITEEVDELNRVLSGYLDFAQSSRSSELAPQSLRRIISRCLLAVHTEAAERGVDVRENVPGEDVTVQGDEKRLRQALLNVVINAVQATESGGRVEISLTTGGTNAVIMVADTGSGIEARNMSRITEPFYTTRAGGSGLGLSVVRSVLDEHGGQLEIESEAGVGTRVSMTLPLATT